ncbi:FRG domain-containing protein [Yimella sp. cx-51]|uniref:FRG domain-containing protein n=1 Tax=Yimella sp. cx-51 TaxID=2770551 RepID=UPI00165E9A71|nr:FRG domain-containing protein [Yimella sp. cx-51]MBC9958380.1 FRG domain-containing protein [Yimella sp. cx-51]QTH38215.1 FRG domain-containing protein [Yimella sp. cx-51]
MNPEDFFRPWEAVANNWREALDHIGSIIDISTSDRDLAWRGVADSTYALHSSIYRRIAKKTGSLPDEASIIAFEQELLKSARRKWRFDNQSALETLAHLQHYGGPTRLLDVSFNPLVALWFAVEQKYDEEFSAKADKDGRMFVFDVTGRQVVLDNRWGGRDLPWASPIPGWSSELPYVWRPPSYNARIPAQNSGFLVGGVPQVFAGRNARYRKGPGDGTSAGTWSIDDVRQSTSVTLTMNVSNRALRQTSKPTFTLRIAAEAKPEIREQLEKRYGFNSASIYPDLYGLAQYGANGIDAS